MFKGRSAGQRSSWQKKRKDYFGAQTSFLWGREEEGFSPCRLPPLSVGVEQARVTDDWCLTSKSQAGWGCFWERLTLRLDLVFNLGLLSRAFSTRDAILGLWFSFNTISWEDLLQRANLLGKAPRPQSATTSLIEWLWESHLTSRTSILFVHSWVGIIIIVPLPSELFWDTSEALTYL